MRTINLFCLPFAGGNKYSYREFEDRAPSYLRVICLEHPGRGGRSGERLMTDVNPMLADLYAQVRGKLDEREYAIYGHSMGGLMASLLAREIAMKGHRLPRHVFITGTTGPSAPSRTVKKRHLMSKADFIREIRELKGVPDEILQSEEMIEYFEPILRADFTATENYIHREESPMDIPVTVITGTDEDMPEEDVFLWQKEFSTPVDFRRLTGSHFFIFQHVGEILGVISNKLLMNTKTSIS